MASISAVTFEHGNDPAPMKLVRSPRRRLKRNGMVPAKAWTTFLEAHAAAREWRSGRSKGLRRRGIADLIMRMITIKDADARHASVQRFSHSRRIFGHIGHGQMRRRLALMLFKMAGNPSPATRIQLFTVLDCDGVFNRAWATYKQCIGLGAAQSAFLHSVTK